MKDEFDVEGSLKDYEHKPSAPTKQSVLAEFEKRAGRVALWKRPVPLYAAAVVLVIAMGFSFAAGQRSIPGASPKVTGHEDAVVTSDDIEWTSAVRDFL
jgi:hypothetical protein